MTKEEIEELIADYEAIIRDLGRKIEELRKQL